MPMMVDLERLYDVCEDYEHQVLDGLLTKAGLLWVCRGPHIDAQPMTWTNIKGEKCEVCGKEESSANSKP